MADEARIDQRGQKVVGMQINVAGDANLPQPPLVLVPRLPPPPRDFTGRDEELQDLLAGFERGATIAGLRGMGGIGKTALAYALVGKLTERYPDGQILVELRGTDPVPITPAEAMARVIRAYHPEFKPPESEAELGNIYHSVLHGTKALLLLDNATDDGQVRPLLPPQSCGVIVTSRRKFSLPCLVPMDLDVLSEDKAVELLLKLWKPGASTSAEQLGDKDLLEIARLCGFLPLALRAAGSLLANSPDLSPAQYARDLQDQQKRLERIGKEGVDLDVESSLGLSYSRLEPETAAVFRILSIFPASFDAAAEEVVCRDEGHRHLSELVRWSLVDYQLPGKESEGRYHLHDLVRLFAASRLQSGEKVQAEQRHAEHYRNILSRYDELYKIGGENVLAGLALFDLEWSNIRAGQAWAERNLEEDSLAAELCRSYPSAGAYVLDLRLHPQERIAWLKKGIDAARLMKDRMMEGVYLGNLGIACMDLGDSRTAIKYFQKALPIARKMGDPMGEGAILDNLGIANKNLGDVGKAIEYCEQALTIAREIGDKRGEGSALGNLGLAYADLSDNRKAIECLGQSLLIAREIGDRRSEGADLGNLGLAYFALGEYLESIEYYEQRLVIAREIRDRRGEGSVLGNLGVAYAVLGDARKAIRYLKQSLKIARETGDRKGEGTDLGNLGLAYKDLRDANKAIECFELLLVMAHQIEDRRGEGNALGNMGLVHADLGDPRKAIDYYEQQSRIADEIDDRRGVGNALWNMSLSLHDLNEHFEAIEKAEMALEIYEQIESPNAEKVRQQLADWRK